VQRCGLSGTFVLISDMTALCHVSLTARLSFVRAYAALLPGDIALSHRHSTSYCYLHSAPLCISCSLHCSQLHISCISVTSFESRCYQLCNSYTSDRCIGLRCSQLSDTSSGTAIQLCTLCLAVRRIALHYPLRCVSQESVTRIALRYSLRCVSQESVTRIALRYSLSDVSIHSSHSSLPRRKTAQCLEPHCWQLAVSKETLRRIHLQLPQLSVSQETAQYLDPNCSQLSVSQEIASCSDLHPPQVCIQWKLSPAALGRVIVAVSPLHVLTLLLCAHFLVAKLPHVSAAAG